MSLIAAQPAVGKLFAIDDLRDAAALSGGTLLRQQAIARARSQAWAFSRAPEPNH